MKFGNFLLSVMAIMTVFSAHQHGYVPVLDAYLGKPQPKIAAVKMEDLMAAALPAENAEVPAEPAAEPAAQEPEPIAPDATMEAAPEAAPAAEIAVFGATSAAETPAPEAPAQAAATPVDLATLDRRLWPAQVQLLKAEKFELKLPGGGKGSMIAPAGVLLDLVAVQGNQLEVKFGQLLKKIPAANTDILKRIPRS